MTDPFLGQVVGKYEVLQKIGQGGMGMVYRGRQMSLNRSVATKVLPAQMALDEDFVQRFQQEAEVIARLTHENIVQVYDIDRHEGTYYLVMEFVDGKAVAEEFGTQSEDIEFKISGEIEFKDPVAKSRLNLTIKVFVTPSLRERAASCRFS